MYSVVVCSSILFLSLDFNRSSWLFCWSPDFIDLYIDVEECVCTVFALVKTGKGQRAAATSWCQRNQKKMATKLTLLFGFVVDLLAATDLLRCEMLYSHFFFFISFDLFVVFRFPYTQWQRNSSQSGSHRSASLCHRHQRNHKEVKEEERDNNNNNNNEKPL